MLINLTPYLFNKYLVTLFRQVFISYFSYYLLLYSYSPSTLCIGIFYNIFRCNKCKNVCNITLIVRCTSNLVNLRAVKQFRDQPADQCGYRPRTPRTSQVLSAITLCFISVVKMQTKCLLTWCIAYNCYMHTAQRTVHLGVRNDPLPATLATSAIAVRLREPHARHRRCCCRAADVQGRQAHRRRADLLEAGERSLIYKRKVS